MLFFTPQPKKRYKKATVPYTKIYEQLGRDFRIELEEAVSRIVQVPTAWHPIKKGFRRCILNRFPFGIIYRTDQSKNECQIFAVMH